MPAPLPVASPSDDGIIVEFTVGDVTLTPMGRNWVIISVPGNPLRTLSLKEFEQVIRAGLRHHDD